MTGRFDHATGKASPGAAAPGCSQDDFTKVALLLGREPAGDFEVVVRDGSGGPAVIRNAPILCDGRPMPTRYWLVEERLRRLVGRLESEGGVRAAEAAVDAEDLAAAHARYAAERDAAIPDGHQGPRPSAGVGGTRRGVKCLHAHYAWHLAGGDDPVGRWVAERLGPAAAASLAEGGVTRDPVAVVDCGTNTTRLLISDGRGPAAERRSEITRLGRGVDATGRLDPAAVERTLECLLHYRKAIDRHRPSAIRVIATSAVRDAANRSEFLQPAESILGAAPEVLSGHQEANLSFRGAVSELDPAEGPFLVVDIGGGSTELSFGAQRCTDALSLDIGSVRLTEKYIHHDPPRPEELSACLTVTELHLDDAVRAIAALGGDCRLVGVAGTITTVAAVELGLATYDRDRVHHFRLSKDAAEDVFRTLATEALADRVHNPGLHPGRADVIVAGVCILVRIMRYFDFDECLVSESDLLDGLALSLLDA